MQKRCVKSLMALVMMLALLMGMAGCATQKLDQNAVQNNQSQAEASGTAPSEAEPTDVTLSDDEKYDMTVSTQPSQEPKPTEEKKQTVKVPISDGKQTGQDAYKTDPIPEGQQVPVEPGQMEVDKTEPLSCYLSISCETILNNMGQLKKGKDVLVPADGMLFYKTAVNFYAGESVYDILKRVTRENGIHMDVNFVPMYNSAYIKGIGNLYEFDCGPGSGWMYRVNGWYPNYGVSRYVPQNGDEIQLLYTCDLGRDIGGYGVVQ